MALLYRISRQLRKSYHKGSAMHGVAGPGLRGAGIGALGFGAVLGLLWLWMGTGPAYNDFTQNAWLPARLVLDGADPYDPTRAQVDAALGPARQAYPTFNSGADFHFIYPMAVALVFLPLAALPLPTALLLWRALNGVLLIWAVISLLRGANPALRTGRAAGVAVGLAVLLAFVYRESIVTLTIGQFSIIELGLLAAIWRTLIATGTLPVGTRPPWTGEVLAGVALGVLAIKPQALGLPVVLIGLWALTRRRWGIPAGAGATLGLLLLGPVLIFPQSLAEWLGIVLGGQAQSQVTVSASVWGISYQWLGADSLWGLVAGGLTVLGLLLLIPWWRADFRDRASPIPRALPLTLCVNALISPYLLGYEHMLLLLPALLILAAVSGQSDTDPLPAGVALRWRLLIYLWLAVLPLLIAVIQIRLAREYPAILQTATMLLFCLMARFRWINGRLTIAAG